MIKGIKKILDQIILGFWIAVGVTLFEFVYSYGFKILKKLLAVITTVKT
jgi:hypothetical protein